MADDEVLFDEVYELCEVIGKWVQFLLLCISIFFRAQIRRKYTCKSKALKCVEISHFVWHDLPNFGSLYTTGA